jgi:type IV fimbrial biogenesis protein FimT
MVTIVILVILIGVAAPSMSDLVRDQRVKTATSDVHSTLVFARSEAIKRNSDVSVCGGAGGDWANGWTVKTTTCTNLAAVTLKSQDALSDLNITQADGSAIGNLTYKGDGRLTAIPPVIVIKSSQSASVTARCIRLDLSGRPNVTVDTDKDSSDGCD